MVNLSGKRFGKLVAVEPSNQRKNGYIMWKCRCDCGREILVDVRKLRRGTAQDCGCNSINGEIDLRGQRFGKLTVISQTNHHCHLGWYWLCQCDCGGKFEAPTWHLISGHRKSCGCLRKQLDANKVFTIANPEEENPANDNTHTGVYLLKRSGKWLAQISYKGKAYYLGVYNNFEDAVIARERGEEMRPDFLNWYYSTYPEKKPHAQ